MQPNQDILLYQSPDGAIRLDVQLDHETVWLTQAQMTELFDTSKQNVSLHVRNLFREGELSENAVVKESLTTAADGKAYGVKHYNLDVIISVGYRVKSARGTQFRQWATQVLRDYLVRGFALNERRLSESTRQLADLKRLVQLQGRVAATQELSPDQSNALLRILGDYTFSDGSPSASTSPPDPLSKKEGAPAMFSKSCCYAAVSSANLVVRVPAPLQPFQRHRHANYKVRATHPVVLEEGHA